MLEKMFDFVRSIRARKQGSMLINVLVSLGIMVVLLTISIPNLRRFRPSLILTTAARDLATDLRYAQQLTITEQIPHGVYFNDVLDNYYIYRLEIPTTTLKTVILPIEVNIDAVVGLTSNLVQFNSYGSVNESGEIILINTQNASTTIYVKPSGYIQVQ